MEVIEELIDNAVLLAVVLAPLTTGIIEVVKTTIEVEKKYLPLISLLIGVAVALLLAIGTGQDLVQYTLVGLVGGLGASGLYDQKDIVEQ